MTDELRAAAERWHNGYPRASESGGKDYVSPFIHNDEWADANKLADAYVAEHPADDADSATVQWLESVGFIGRTWGGYIDYANGHLLCRYFASGAIIWYFNHMNVPTAHTRGHVRRLCAALGIALTGPTK